MLCLTLTEDTIQDDLDCIRRNSAYVDLVELRLDTLKDAEIAKAKDVPHLTDKPVILTYRRKSDGGKAQVSEKERLEKLCEIAQGDFAYVDIEGDVKKSELRYEKDGQKFDLETSLRERGVRIIRSYHDFAGLPADLFGRVTKLASKGDIAKVAVTPHSIMDVITLFRIQEEVKDVKEKIVIGMGPWGVCTRILYKKLGSLLSFVTEGSGSGIGQLDARTMKELYRADQVDERTAVYGVIGNPVHHSSSPMIQNLGFHAIHFNAIYVPFLVDNVRSFFKLAEMVHIHGFSVTIPFKRDVLPYLGKISRETKQIGACNTVVHINNLWKGLNTDYYGFLQPLSPMLDKGQIKRALVIGAGGAAQAVSFALRNHDVKVTIVNRTIEHAEQLSRLTMSGYDSLDHINQYSGKVDLVVQTTSVGMVPNEGEDASHGFKFTGSEIAFDLVYKPRETVFLSRAKQAGCRTVGGAQMLLEQGKLQFESFTGYHYPPKVYPEI